MPISGIVLGAGVFPRSNEQRSMTIGDLINGLNGAKATAEAKQIAADMIRVTLTQADQDAVKAKANAHVADVALAAGLAKSGPVFTSNPDGTFLIFEPDNTVAGYHEVIAKPDSTTLTNPSWRITSARCLELVKGPQTPALGPARARLDRHLDESETLASRSALPRGCPRSASEHSAGTHAAEPVRQAA
jgi:hypothetical protein